MARPRCVFVSSEFICAEVEAKLAEKLGFSSRHAALLTRFVRRQSELTSEAPNVRGVCRDPDDEPVLAAAVGNRCE